ncbi:ABC transporter permease subunit [Ornatilinea apprima]|uniref:ABC transporter permease subunit n=1 Tax=Ornatilinea apprima TaxID=1134406 RepID=UPI0009468636|nr:ABC transporter permease subunit [Ornatilinea apprima]
MESQVEKSPDAVPQWMLDLDQVGFVRRLFLARKWYGGDWWFVLISAIMLLFIIIVGIFPQWFAPYDPRAEVGPSLLAPNEPPPSFELLVLDGKNIQSLRDIGDKTNNIGFVIGSPASQALRDAVDTLNKEAEEEGLSVRYQPRPRRYETLELGLTDLVEGKVDAFIVAPEEIEGTIAQYPQITVLRSLTGASGKGFFLGTNQIGQDVFSRIIWGTRIALIVGLSSAIVSFLIGVPLGLISGFVSGPFDRVLTLIMDSLYSFPGLILAISIAAVLGPGIGNIIVSIAVLYVPTYFRIVRGQTLSVKQELYVEAARSLGTSPLEILTKYIFPNVIPSVVIIFSVNVGDAILTEAGLSFLGFGLPPDTPDWGIDLARGQDYLRRAWWLIFYPGLMVSLVTLSFSMLGESLSEILNPKLAEL